MEQAIKIGMSKEDIIVDGLVATIGANPRAAIECYETFSYCKNELGLPTACGDVYKRQLLNVNWWKLHWMVILW